VTRYHHDNGKITDGSRATGGSSKALTVERSIIWMPGKASTSSGNVGKENVMNKPVRQTDTPSGTVKAVSVADYIVDRLAAEGIDQLFQ